MLKRLFPVILGAIVSAVTSNTFAQAPVFDPQGRTIPHDERKVEPQNEAAIDPPLTTTKPAAAAKKRHHGVKHKPATKPSVHRKAKPVHKKAAPR
ncbi:MAG TPA: hypothetical protein VL550_08275 [Rhodocyclaceae bacterium]|nr:hypothetical protein [Rhodocyclaceae bacterium]